MPIQIIGWDYLLDKHRNPPIETIHRTEFVENKYKIFKFILKQKLKTNNQDYIYKYIINPNIQERFILTQNAFKYNLEDNINHLLLWVNPEHKLNKIIYQEEINLNQLDYLEDVIFDKLKKKFNKNKLNNLFEFIYFENLVNNRSVPGIKHLQIFVKIKKDNSSL